MKKSTTLLIAVAVCMASAVWGANAFTVNVMVGSASGNPSLVFGQGTNAEQKPFPPFSAMFGVKDVYLANSENFGAEAKVSGDFSRLGTDIRTVSDDNKWVLTAATDATAYFQFAEGEATLYLAEEGVEEAKPLPGNLSLKAGKSYTISTRSATRAVVPVQDPSGQTVYLEADSSTDLYTGKATVEKLGSASSATLFLTTGDGPIYLYDGAKYYANDGTSGVVAPEAGWLLSLDATSIAYSGDTAIVNFASATDKLDLSATTAKAYKPISTTVCVNNVRIASVNWVVKSTGTIDFDGNGEVDDNDAMYLYNYVSAGCPTAEDEWFTADGLADFTFGATPEELQTALDNLRNLLP